MPERGNNGEVGGWSDLRPHEEFLELCAISTTGELSEEEEKRLRDHVEQCAECRQALKEFETVADVGVPLLSSRLSLVSSDEPQARSDGAAEAMFTRGQLPLRSGTERFSAIGTKEGVDFRTSKRSWQLPPELEICVDAFCCRCAFDGRFGRLFVPTRQAS